MVLHVFTETSRTAILHEEVLQDSSAPILQGYPSIHHPHLHVHIQRILHPEIQFYTQKTKSSSSTTTTYRGQRDLQSRFQKRNSMHRRQGDLLEIHPCVLQDIPGIPAARPSKGTPVITDIQVFPDIPVFPVFPDISDIPVIPENPEIFRTFQSFMTFQPFQAILQVPVFPENPPHFSILQLECIFYSSIGFHRKLHRVPVEQFHKLYKHYIPQRKGDVAISVKLTYSPE